MRSLIALVLNVIWLVTAGFWLWLGYLLAGVVACVFIITIPFGVASFRIAGYVLWPFGREVVDRGAPTGMSTIGNVIWFVVAGLWLAIGHVFTAAAQAVTIIGIPLAWANLKLIPVTCFPFSKEIVSSEDRRAAMMPVARR
ncbi:YccF domain-containing protein [Dietzia sp.]|uniref:YccF domain-containing protein n=1 Tax=Dietzia sp. TaxID=1871616 RepID=UPI002FD90A2B